MKEEKKEKTFQVHQFPVELIDRINEEAKKNRVFVSHIVINAIQEYLKKSDKK